MLPDPLASCVNRCFLCNTCSSHVPHVMNTWWTRDEACDSSSSAWITSRCLSRGNVGRMKVKGCDTRSWDVTNSGASCWSKQHVCCSLCAAAAGPPPPPGLAGKTTTQQHNNTKQHSQVFSLLLALVITRSEESTITGECAQTTLVTGEQSWKTKWMFFFYSYTMMGSIVHNHTRKHPVVISWEVGKRKPRRVPVRVLTEAFGVRWSDFLPEDRQMNSE